MHGTKKKPDRFSVAIFGLRFLITYYGPPVSIKWSPHSVCRSTSPVFVSPFTTFHPGAVWNAAASVMRCERRTTCLTSRLLSTLISLCATVLMLNHRSVVTLLMADSERNHYHCSATSVFGDVASQQAIFSQHFNVFIHI